MIAKELISNEILPLQLNDNCAQAMTMMSIYRLKDMPVVDENGLVGMISEEVVSTTDPETLIEQTYISKSYVYVQETDHIFEVLNRLAQNNMTVVPVVDDNEKFLGIISQEDLIKFYANTFSFKEPGSIIVIESTRRGYSLSEVARIVELESATVISSFVSSNEDSENILLTIKVNQQEISNIISALERYDYNVSATFVEDEYSDDLKDRYDMLMNYLNI
ncbi:MAG: CBS domain-containing protein [Saprospiraceae bacterium]|nr:CBS domain-containing protein [Saprospiraceae bacterium]